MASKSQISTQESFQEDASPLHLTAFFNPNPKKRERALKEIRAAAGHPPRRWKRLDLAAGITAGMDEDEIKELQADSPLPYQAGVDHSQNVLDEQFVGSTIVDRLINAGFGVNSSLSNYVYTTQLREGRMQADMSMNPRARGIQDHGRSGLDGVPLPIAHADYELDGRELEVANEYGSDPESEQATEARRAINRLEARTLWEGWGGEFDIEGLGAFTVGGLDTDDATKAIQVASTDAAGWDNPDVLLNDLDLLHESIETQTDVNDPDDIPLVSEVGARLFVPRGQWGNVMRQDYETTATDEPLSDRINRKYPYVDITPAPRLDDSTAIFMLNDTRYFQIVNAQGMTNTAWDVDGGFARRHKLVSSRIPFVRIQPDGIRGIVRMTGV